MILPRTVTRPTLELVFVGDKIAIIIAFQYSCTAQMCAPDKVQFYLQYQEANGGALLLLAGRLKRKEGREGIGGGVRLAVVTSAPPLVVTLLGRSGRHG